MSSLTQFPFGKHPDNPLYWLVYIEGWSYILLVFVTVPMKYLLGYAEISRWMGMAHGVLFTLIILRLLIQALEKSWNWKYVSLLFGLTLVPFGSFYICKKMLARGN